MEAAIYTRISSDLAGQGLGVARQQTDCHALADRLGWDVTHVYSDNDVSAFSGRARPGYQALLDAIDRGEVEAVLAWHPDRLHRSPSELERFIDLVERHGVAVATVQAGRLDLSTAAGRMTARVVGAVARHESEQKSERQKRKALELAERGLPAGGSRRFGWQDGSMELDPTEAALVREAARRVLAGESLGVIADEWTRRGIPTVRGGKWATTTIRTILVNPRIAGLRTHHGEVVGPAAWEPIIDRDTYERLRSVILSRGRSRTRPVRAYMLTGLAVCGLCGVPMVAAPRSHGRAYGCPARTRGGCGGTSIMADPVEALVADQAAVVVADTDILSRITDADTAEATEMLTAAEALLLDYAAMLDAGEITRAEWTVLRAGAVRQVEEAHERLAEAAAPGALAGSSRDGWRGWWAGLSLETRRAALGALIDRVEIGRSGPVGPRVNLDRVTVHWR